MELQEIQVFIDKNGEVQIEVHGVKGKKCLDMTVGLEEALGGEIASREMTAEAYVTVQEEVQDRPQLRDSR
jgi:hypothetical protein